MVKNTRKISALTICSALPVPANRLDRYCGSVIASPAALENRRSRAAIKTQLAMVPSARPMPIHALPKPKAITLPGRPISSQALISDAWALMAVTHGPIWRLPRKYSFSLPPLVFKKKYTPMLIISTKYRINTAISIIFILSAKYGLILSCFPA